jgi:hypothetical protein
MFTSKRHVVYLARESSGECLFYSSRPALEIYVTLALFVLTQQKFILYAVLVILFREITKILLRWINYITGDPETRDALAMARDFTIRIIHEMRRIVACKNTFGLLLTCSMVPRNLMGMGYRNFILFYVTNSIYADITHKAERWKDFRIRRLTKLR